MLHTLIDVNNAYVNSTSSYIRIYAKSDCPEQIPLM